jgi:hypothetical protein
VLNLIPYAHISTSFSVQGDFTDEMAGAPSLILWVSKTLEKRPQVEKRREKEKTMGGKK